MYLGIFISKYFVFKSDFCSITPYFFNPISKMLCNFSANRRHGFLALWPRKRRNKLNKRKTKFALTCNVQNYMIASPISFNLIQGFRYLQLKPAALHRLYVRHPLRYTVTLNDVFWCSNNNCIAFGKIEKSKSLFSLSLMKELRLRLQFDVHPIQCNKLIK